MAQQIHTAHGSSSSANDSMSKPELLRGLSIKVLDQPDVLYPASGASVPLAAVPERAASVPIPPTPPLSPERSPCPSCASSSCCHPLEPFMTASQSSEHRLTLLQPQANRVWQHPAALQMPVDVPSPQQQSSCWEQEALPGYEPASSILSGSVQRQLSMLDEGSSIGSLAAPQGTRPQRRVRFGAVVYHYYVPDPQPCLQEILHVQAAQRRELLAAGMLTEDSEDECSEAEGSDAGSERDSDSSWEDHDHDCFHHFCHRRHVRCDSDSDGHDHSSDGCSMEDDAPDVEESDHSDDEEEGSDSGSIATYECRQMPTLTPAVAQFARFAPLLGLDIAGGAPIRVFRRIQALYGVVGADAGGARSSCGCSCDQNAYQLLELMEAVRCMPRAAMAHALGVRRNQQDLLELFACQLLRELSS